MGISLDENIIKMGSLWKKKVEFSLDRYDGDYIRCVNFGKRSAVCSESGLEKTLIYKFY